MNILKHKEPPKKSDQQKELIEKEKDTSSRRSVVKVWLFPFLSVTIFVVVGVFIVKPWIEDIFDKRDQMVVDREDISLLLSKLEVLNDQDLDQLKDYLVRLSLAVPEKLAPTLILSTIERAVNESGLVLNNVQYRGVGNVEEEVVQSEVNEIVVDDGSGEVVITPTPVAVQPGTTNNTPSASQTGNTIRETIVGGEVEINMSTEGGFAQVLAFLKTIEKINPLILGITFEVHGSTASNIASQDVALKEFNYQGVAPFQGLPTDLGALTSEVVTLTKDELEKLQKIEDFETYINIGDDSALDEIPAGKTDPF